MFQMLLQFEKELAQAVEALTKEQEKAAQAEREKQTQVVKPSKMQSLDPLVLLGVEFQNKEREKVLRESNGIRDVICYVYLSYQWLCVDQYT